MALAFIGVAVGGGLLLAHILRQGGQKADISEVHQASIWQGQEMVNPQPIIASSDRWIRLYRNFFDDSYTRRPTQPLPMVTPSAEKLSVLPESGLRATWFGHATALVEIDGARVLIDPMWSELASPIPGIGPHRFYLPSVPIEDLPPIDAVVISHDHYDHLDMDTVVALKDKVKNWVVPLGVGAHLRQWGIADERITELDWWQEKQVGDLKLVATPSRHYSGRLSRANRSLWAGWALIGPEHSVFYSGDTSLHNEFARIGEELGPFDLTMIESGSYSEMWPDSHLGPEQAVIVHKLVQGNVMMPVHWAGFNMAPHGWTEPVERVLVAAEQLNVPVTTPMPGQSIELDNALQTQRWWPTLTWRTAAMNPVWSSDSEDELSQFPELTSPDN